MPTKEVDSCIKTVEMLRRLALNIHGVIDVVDDENCKKIISALKQYGALQDIQKEICDMYPKYTDENGYRMIRKSDVLNIIDKHIKEIEG